ncbi:MAG: hypothetical protein ABEL97_14940 [Salinibacter sp.]
MNPFTLPGQHTAFWTGLRVCEHDGAQHHLVGIQPGVRVERTTDGLRPGPDETLRTARRLLRDALSTE